ncbi:MAG: sulfatase-like hydrolase/transferase [Anaerolineales bacterium]|nr:sulfatase-like hydrolase/transferase [Anaerolineales bacterium]
MPKNFDLRLSWRSLFTQTLLAAYAYVFMEWLFFATKSSFMDALAFGKKLELFLLTGLILAALALAAFALLRVLGLIPGPTMRGQAFPILAGLIPALLAAALSLLLIDNFTYTVFQFGIVTSQGALRAGYAVLSAVLLILWYRQVLIRANRHTAAPGKTQAAARSRRVRFSAIPIGLAAGLALAALSIVIGLVRLFTSTAVAGSETAAAERLPHIVFLAGEGLDSKWMSLYGYRRDTTPNLRQLAETGLLAENNFTNAAHTTGSEFSLLTGKYPAATRLLYAPNILQGQDAYEHLPGILQRAGYTTVQITFPYYIDAYDVNLQEGFDEVNGRSLGEEGISPLARKFHWEDAGYFLPQLSERIFDRLLHIFFIREMPDPYREVIQAVDPNRIAKMTDQARIGRLGRTLRDAESPMFVHVHLMETHGPMFYPRRRVFSSAEIQDKEWMRDFFDDAILDFDAYVGEFVDYLKDADLWDSTVLVVYSDHVDGWKSNDRIPLLLHFPGGEYAGRIRNNTQNLDIAPTILDYLGMEKPAWMSGLSLLAGEPPALRPILSAGVDQEKIYCAPPDWWCSIDPAVARPPFYQFGYLQAVICQKMARLTLNINYYSELEVFDHTAPCPAADLPDRNAVHAIMVEHLRTYGFDVSSLE